MTKIELNWSNRSRGIRKKVYRVLPKEVSLLCIFYMSDLITLSNYTIAKFTVCIIVVDLDSVIFSSPLQIHLNLINEELWTWKMKINQDKTEKDCHNLFIWENNQTPQKITRAHMKKKLQTFIRKYSFHIEICSKAFVDLWL